MTQRPQVYVKPAPHQYGFAEHKSSEQVLTTLVADISDSFETEFPANSTGRRSSGYALVCFVDAAAAYCSVNPDRFIKLLLDHKVPMYLIRFFQAFLSNRSQRVTWKGFRDEWRKTPWGGAQGLQSMPQIWRIFFSDLLDKFPRLAPFFDPALPQEQRSRLKWACLADDLTIWATGKSYADCHALLQRAAQVVTEWSLETGIEISEKSAVMPFHPTTQRTLPTDLAPIRLGGHLLPCDSPRENRLLGLWFDTWLNFHFFVTEILLPKIRAFVPIFKFMKNIKLQHKRALLFGAVVARVLYGVTAYWERISLDDRNSIIAAVGVCARTACGAMPGTAAATAMSECGMDSLPTMVNRHTMRLVEKTLRLPAERQLNQMMRRARPPTILARFVFDTKEDREPLLTPDAEPKWDPTEPAPPVQFVARSFMGLRADAPADLRRESNVKLVWHLSPDIVGLSDGSIPEKSETSAAAAVIWVRPTVAMLNAPSLKTQRRSTGTAKKKIAPPTPLFRMNTTPPEDTPAANTFRTFEPDFVGRRNTGPMASSFRPESIGIELLIEMLKGAVAEARADREAKGITSRIRVLALTDSMSNLDELARGPHRQRSYRGACTWKHIQALRVGQDCDLILGYVHSHCSMFIHDVVDHRAGEAAMCKPPLTPVTSVWYVDAARERAKLVSSAPHELHSECFHDTIVKRRTPWRLSSWLSARDQRLLAQMRTDAVHGLGQLYRQSRSDAGPCPFCGDAKSAHMDHMLRCEGLLAGLAKYPRVVQALKRGKFGLTTDPCESALAFRVAIYLTKVPPDSWGRADIIDDKVLKPFRDFYEKMEAEEAASNNKKPHLFKRK